MSAHDSLPEECRQKWSFKPDYPKWSRRHNSEPRKALAIKIGLGRKPAPPPAPKPKRTGTKAVR
jgi:predicted transcriptional regulator